MYVDYYTNNQYPIHKGFFIYSLVHADPTHES